MNPSSEMPADKPTKNEAKEPHPKSWSEFQKLIHNQKVEIDKLSEEIKSGKTSVQIANAQVAANAMYARAGFINFLLDKKGQTLYEECGYPLAISPTQYREMFDREGIGYRVVTALPEESWADDPAIYDDEDEDIETDFEEDVSAIVKRTNLMHYWERADVLSRIGAYGVLFIGFDDGLDAEMPLEGIPDDLDCSNWAELIANGEFTPANHKVLYVRAFDQPQVHIVQWERNQQSKRYGLPLMYQLRFMDYTMIPAGETVGDTISLKCHWTRCIHLADNRKSSEVFGTPAQQHHYNRELDIRKILSSSAEMFYKGGFPGYALEVLPEYGDSEIDQEQVRQQMEEYQNSLKRYISIAGVSVKSLLPQIADPEKQVMTHLKIICACEGVPWKVFMGSESGHLGGEDKSDDIRWHRRLARRQNKYLTPMVIRPTIDRFICAGAVRPPESSEYTVEWPDLNLPSEEDEADVAQKLTMALASYITSGAQSIFPLREYLTIVWKLPPERAEMVAKAAEDYVKKMEVEMGDDTTIAHDGSITRPQPDPESISKGFGDKSANPKGDTKGGKPKSGLDKKL